MKRNCAMLPLNLVLLLLGLLYYSKAQEEQYTVCSKLQFNNQCQQVGRNHELKCAKYLHNVDCLLNVDNGTTTFGSIKAEEAVLGARRTNKVVVVGEIQPVTGDKPYQTVVIIKNGVVQKFSDFKTKKFCHPGFQFDKYVSDLALQEFEQKVIEGSQVDICSNKANSLKEKYVQTLSQFFGPSCRPGPWTVDEKFDAELKKKYPSLCELCPSNLGSDKCSVNSKNPFNHALNCLVENNADVALTTLHEAKVFFNITENKQKYQYFCPNEMISQPDSPCTWTNRVWDLIIAHEDQAQAIKSKLEEWLNKSILPPDPTPYAINPDALSQHLLDILGIFKSDTQGIKLINGSLPKLLDYVQGFQTVPIETNKRWCNTEIKWCTISDKEQEKCLWLSQASLNSDIQPVITCGQRSSSLECLEDVQNNKADIITIDANYGYIAKRKNLVAVAFPETEGDSLLYVYVAIKVDDKSIQRFENLRNKQACFPEYGGIEWLTWIDIARTKGILSKKTCDYGKLISDFVGDSCVPGANSNDHEVTSNTNKDKLCSICRASPTSPTSKNCNADSLNEFYGVNGTLKCLSNIGDFAVISKRAGEKFEDAGYRVLCKNGTLAAYPGFNVDQNCALAVITESEVVIKRNSEKKQDIVLVLKELERRFGQQTNKPFELFNEFGGTYDLLFKDSTPGLDFGDSTNPFIVNYINLFQHIDQCVADGKSGAALPNVLFIFILLMYSFTRYF